MREAISFLFGIHDLSPTKLAWVIITVTNVAMMVWLSWRYAWQTFGMYMLFLAGCTLLQGSQWWGMDGEAVLAGTTTAFVFRVLPKHTYGRIFALSIGLVVTCVLMLAVPPPWAGYDPAMYATRLYSTAAFLGVAFGSALMTRNPSTMLAVPWFMAVLVAGSQRGYDRWAVGIYTNLTWTAVLICWLYLSRRKDERDTLVGVANSVDG